MSAAAEPARSDRIAEKARVRQTDVKRRDKVRVMLPVLIAALQGQLEHTTKAGV
jgi:hypothetical protein